MTTAARILQQLKQLRSLFVWLAATDLLVIISMAVFVALTKCSRLGPTLVEYVVPRQVLIPLLLIGLGCFTVFDLYKTRILFFVQW